MKEMEEKVKSSENTGEEEIKKVVKEKLDKDEGTWSEMLKRSMKEVLGEKDESRKEEKEALERCEEEVRKMKWQKEKDERFRKRNNIVITGLRRKENMTAEEVEEFLKQKITVSVEVEAVWWVYVNNEKAVGAEIRCWEDELKVMKNKSKLKDAERRIFIEDDTTVQERNVRRILLEKAREMRGKGSTVKVEYDGERYEEEEERNAGQREEFYRRLAGKRYIG